MGLGNKLIVSATGFPGTNKTLRFIQDAFREPLGALAQLAGDKTIITGVVVDVSNNTVSNGFITYNGEIIPFQGGVFVDTITIIEAFENVNYNTDANNDTILDSLPAYRTIYAKCGTGGIDIFKFSDLARLKTIRELSNFALPNNIVIDADYVHTDVNFTIQLLNKLSGIEDGAQKNVQADWSEINNLSDAFIRNKPTVPKILYIGSNWIGDINQTDILKTIYFPNIGTNNYIVIINVTSVNVGSWNDDNDFSYVILNKQANFFQMGFKEYAANTQNLNVEFILIAK